MRCALWRLVLEVSYRHGVPTNAPFLRIQLQPLERQKALGFRQL